MPRYRIVGGQPRVGGTEGVTRLGLAGLSEYPQSREWQGLGDLAQEADPGLIYDTGWYTSGTANDEWWYFDAATQAWDFWGIDGSLAEATSLTQTLTQPVAQPVYDSGTGWYYEDSTASWWWLDASTGVWTDYGPEIADTAGTDWSSIWDAVKAGVATAGQLSTVLQKYGILPQSGQQYRINPTTRRAEIYDPISGAWKVAQPISPTGTTGAGLFGLSPTVLLIGAGVLLFVLSRGRR